MIIEDVGDLFCYKYTSDVMVANHNELRGIAVSDEL